MILAYLRSNLLRLSSVLAELSNESTTATPLPTEDQAGFDLDRRFL